jgi:uncharacterized Tic20 family protein
MLPKYHLIIGAVISFILWLLFPSFFTPVNSLIIFLSSVFIDVDHYLYYVHKKKDWSLKKAYRWFVDERKIWLNLSKKERKNYKITIMIFHGVELWVILALLIFINKIFLFVLIGIFIHMVIDFIELYTIEKPLYSKVSQVYTFKKNQGKRD